MNKNCFVRQEATVGIISNVTSFCATCYSEIVANDTIFYDMKNCCYLCESCQEKQEENLDLNCESIRTNGDALF